LTFDSYLDISIPVYTLKIEKRKEVELMPAKVDEDTCTACGACAEVCPADAITVEDSAKVDPELCTECGACVEECPLEAISLEE
jgi:ferredoxin